GRCSPGARGFALLELLRLAFDPGGGDPAEALERAALQERDRPLAGVLARIAGGVRRGEPAATLMASAAEVLPGDVAGILAAGARGGDIARAADRAEVALRRFIARGALLRGALVQPAILLAVSLAL